MITRSRPPIGADDGVFDEVVNPAVVAARNVPVSIITGVVCDASVGPADSEWLEGPPESVSGEGVGFRLGMHRQRGRLLTFRFLRFIARD